MALREKSAWISFWTTLIVYGAYFAYVEHPYPMPSDQLAKTLVHEAGILMLPGTMFQPAGAGKGQLRIAFANIDTGGIAELFKRLTALSL